VAGGLLKDEKISIGHERSYQYILKDKKLGGFLYEHLRCQKTRRKQYGTKVHDRRGQIVEKVSIEKRSGGGLQDCRFAGLQVCRFAGLQVCRDGVYVYY